MIVAMVGRFFITYAMNAGAQISLEVCPTELRGQGCGLANVFAQASVFFAPYIVYSVLRQNSSETIINFKAWGKSHFKTF